MHFVNATETVPLLMCRSARERDLENSGVTFGWLLKFKSLNQHFERQLFLCIVLIFSYFLLQIVPISFLFRLFYALKILPVTKTFISRGQHFSRMFAISSFLHCPDFHRRFYLVPIPHCKRECVLVTGTNFGTKQAQFKLFVL